MSEVLTLDAVRAALGGMDSDSLQDALVKARKITGAPRWVPNFGPQTDAYFSEADELFYGGQAGGGKTDLEIGSSLTAHHRSLILRRTNKEALGLIERTAEIVGNRDGWSGQAGIWRIDDRTIEMSGCQLEDDKQKFKGSPHDLICVGRGTQVLMGDRSYKAVEDIVVGDLVATLEGPRRVLRAFRVTDRPAVVLSYRSGSQVQSASHRVLTQEGWLSSDDLSAPRPCSPPTGCRSSCIFDGSTARPDLQLSPSVAASNTYPPHTDESAQPTQGLTGRLESDACVEPLLRESGCAESCASCQETLPPPVSFAPQGLRPQAQDSDEQAGDQHSAGRETCGGCTSSTPPDCLGDCRDEPRSYGAPSPQFAGLRIVPTDDPALFQRRDDAGRPSPTGSVDGAQGSIPTRTRPTSTYPHPYGKGIRSTAADLSGYSTFVFLPTVVDELFDLEVEEVNHFITEGGIVNKNCFDEVSDFTESQYVFIIGWNRSTKPGQRCRVIAAGNPPTRPEGLWVVKRWAAWLDPTHPNPAKPGELRYYTTGEDGHEIEVDGPGPHIIGGEAVIARSRTFIPAELSDNPDLVDSGYAATLAALPEELRAAYRDGRFDVGLKDRAYQCIPTAWVRLAQARWTEAPPQGVPMCSMGVDASGGGTDPMIIARRHDGWFAPIVRIAAKDIPIERAGAHCAGVVISYRRDDAVVVVDLGGGYGSSMYEQLHANNVKAVGYKGATEATGKTLCGKFKFNNQRSAALWKFREALDPGQPGGSTIMLPPSPTLLADLTAPTYEPDSKQIIVESKKKVCERLGRSTDEGDAVVMAWSKGITQVNLQGGFAGYNARRKPQVVLGRQDIRR